MNTLNIVIKSVAFTCGMTFCLNVLAGPTAVSGSSTMTYTDRKVIAIPDTKGEMLMMGTVKGLAKSDGPMNGANANNEEIAQLFQGNGEQAGYYTLSNQEGSMIAKWHGHVTTVIKEGNPMVSFKGVWEYVGGSGKYQKVQGKGDYHGYFTSPDSYVVDWKGEYSLD